MKVTYTDPLLQQAAACLEDIVRSSVFADEVRAEWERSEDQNGRALYTLRLSAWGESVSASFAPRELRDLREVRWNLLDLWGNLLQLSLEQSLKNLSKGSDGA